MKTVVAKDVDRELHVAADDHRTHFTDEVRNWLAAILPSPSTALRLESSGSSVPLCCRCRDDTRRGLRK